MAKIISPVKGYTGLGYGLAFADGVAYTDVPHVVQACLSAGYGAEVLEGDSAALVAVVANFEDITTDEIRRATLHPEEAFEVRSRPPEDAAVTMALDPETRALHAGPGAGHLVGGSPDGRTAPAILPGVGSGAEPESTLLGGEGETWEAGSAAGMIVQPVGRPEVTATGAAGVREALAAPPPGPDHVYGPERAAALRKLQSGRAKEGERIAEATAATTAASDDGGSKAKPKRSRKSTAKKTTAKRSSAKSSRSRSRKSSRSKPSDS